jgi:hypothetical protein
MKSNATVAKRRYKIPKCFRDACRAAHITVEEALQQFVDAVSIAGYLDKHSSEPPALAGTFIYLCRLYVMFENNFEIETPTHKGAALYLQRIKDIAGSGEKPARKKRLIAKLISNWHAFAEANKTACAGQTQYNIHIAGEFYLLCDALLLSADGILFLYMTGVNEEVAETEPMNISANLSTLFFYQVLQNNLDKH